MKRLFWIPLVVFLLLTVGTFYLAFQDGLWIYFDFASMIVVYGFSFLIMLSLFGPREMGKAFRSALEKTPFDKKEVEQGLVFFRTLQKLFFSTAGLGFFIGLIAVLRDISNPTRVGQNLAIALLVVLYAFFGICLITIPYTGALKKRLAGNN